MWFAKGGIVDGMTPFSFGAGRLGIMGEAGPEAIMPTQRMANGDLGVRVELPAWLNRQVQSHGEAGLRAELAITNARLSAALNRLDQIQSNTQGAWLDQQRATRAVEDMNRHGVQVYTNADEPLAVKNVEEESA